jgi:hypothetical protein
MTPNDKGQALRPTFMGYIMMFAKLHVFTSSMTPFAARKYGQEWFTRPFPSSYKKPETKYLLVWEAFLTPRILTLRFNPSKVQVTLTAYQPNLVARQFGLIRALLKCLYDKKGSLLLYNAVHNETTALKQITKYTGRTQLTPLNFEPNFLCTRDFGRWWNIYYTEEFYDVSSFIQHFDKAFLLVQEKTKKDTYTLIKEIQAFQYYFETAYKPGDLR